MNYQELEKLKKKELSDIPYHVLNISEINNGSVKAMNLCFFETVNGSFPLYSEYYKPISRIFIANNSNCTEEIID
jgi:hypothetical protein